MSLGRVFAILKNLFIRASNLSVSSRKWLTIRKHQNKKKIAYKKNSFTVDLQIKFAQLCKFVSKFLRQIFND